MTTTPTSPPGFRDGVEAAAKVAASWTDPSGPRLRCGEMTAQEMRTARAVANGIVSSIRSLPTPDRHSPTGWNSDMGEAQLVHTVLVVTPDGDEHHIFSTAVRAEAYAAQRGRPCIISTYVIDAPERYTDAAQ